MIDLTKPVQTRDGRKVRVLCTDMKSETPIVGVVTQPAGKEEACWWYADGRYSLTPGHSADLINVPDTRVVWVNMYPESSSAAGACHRSQAKADKYAATSRIACVRVEYEVGQFDEEVE